MSSLLQFRLIYENGLCNIDIGNKLNGLNCKATQKFFKW